MQHLSIWKRLLTSCILTDLWLFKSKKSMDADTPNTKPICLDSRQNNKALYLTYCLHFTMYFVLLYPHFYSLNTDMYYDFLHSYER